MKKDYFSSLDLTKAKAVWLRLNLFLIINR